MLHLSILRHKFRRTLFQDIEIFVILVHYENEEKEKYRFPHIPQDDVVLAEELVRAFGPERELKALGDVITDLFSEHWTLCGMLT